MTAHTIIVRNRDEDLVSKLGTFFHVEYHPQQGVYEITGSRHSILSSFAENVARDILPAMSEEEQDLFFYQLQAICNDLIRNKGQ
jgi:hypothetical protein